jgi:hypothetical protein
MAPAAMQLVAQVDSERTSADEVELVRLGNEPLQVRLRSLCCPPGDATPLVHSLALGSTIGRTGANIASSDLPASADCAHEEKADAVQNPPLDPILDLMPNLPPMESRADEDAFFTPSSQTAASRPQTPVITSFARDDPPKNRTVPDRGSMLPTESYSGSGLVSAFNASATAFPTGSSDIRGSDHAAAGSIDGGTIQSPMEAPLPNNDPVENARDTLPSFQPLIDALLHVKGSAHIKVLMFNLRSFPDVPHEMPAFEPWIDQAKALGLLVRNGDQLKIPPWILLSHASVDHASKVQTLSEVDQAYLGEHAVLVQSLCLQRAVGKAHGQSKCSDVSSWIRRQYPSWMTHTWNFREYLADGARRGLVTVDYPSTHPDGSVRLSDDWQHSLSSMRRFQPLRAFCAGQDRVNLSVVANDLKASHPGLIPSGAGKVRAYMDDAVAAGVVVYLDEQREWFRLAA